MVWSGEGRADCRDERERGQEKGLLQTGRRERGPIGGSAPRRPWPLRGVPCCGATVPQGQKGSLRVHATPFAAPIWAFGSSFRGGPKGLACIVRMVLRYTCLEGARGQLEQRKPLPTPLFFVQQRRQSIRCAARLISRLPQALAGLEPAGLGASTMADGLRATGLGAAHCAVPLRAPLAGLPVVGSSALLACVCVPPETDLTYLNSSAPFASKRSKISPGP